MPFSFLIILASAALVVSGFFAAASAALSALSRADIFALALAHSARVGRPLRAIFADLTTHINAAAFACVAAAVSAISLVTIAVANVTDQSWLVFICASVGMTVGAFVLVVTLAGNVGREHARSTLRWTSIGVHTLSVIVGPLVSGLVGLGNRLSFRRSGSRGVASEAPLLPMVDEATEFNVLAEDNGARIHSIVRFNDTVVREVMIPRTDMVTIQAEASIGSAMAIFISRNVSRVPVIDGDVDTVRGVLYLRDVAQLVYERPGDSDALAAGELARRAFFVPESKRADDMLKQMQNESNHLALVVDEYGGIAGLVTLEDLIEELVADIFDEYDREVVGREDLGSGRFRVAASVSLGALGNLFNTVLDDDDVDSVGGLLTKSLGRLPYSGATATAQGLVLTAERTDDRSGRIRTVIVERDNRGAGHSDVTVKGRE